MMLKLTIKVDGMMCSMCEAHMNDAVRAVQNVKNVSSSHKKGETVILAETDIADSTLRDAIEKTGYRVLSIHREPYEKKSFLDKLLKR